MLKLDIDIEKRIYQILDSDIVNYLETSERLILKNILEKESISELEINNLDKIFVKYARFIKN
tara:strand:+ start:1196 stop:1384 length:189 start_codon:yes stop_codon:yes gene_type:complete